MTKKPNDLYVLLGVKKTATQEEIKEAFHTLAKELHPDRNPSKKAEERFKAITAAHEILSDPTRRAEHDRGGPTVIKSYTVEGLRFMGDVADVYSARDSAWKQVALKIARDPRDNALLENEAKVLRAVRPPDEPEVGKMRYFPTVVDSFKINDGRMRQVTITKWLRGFDTFYQVVEDTKDLRFEHAVWMFNRILEGLAVIHKAGYVHGGIVPTNLMVFGSSEVGLTDLYDHGVKIIDFTGAVPIGQHAKLQIPMWGDLYPPEVRAKQPLTPATDLYMATACAQFFLKKTDGPVYLHRFLSGCRMNNQGARPQDAWELHEEFKGYMRKHYGPKKYFPFRLPQQDA
jgi:serine/threonine protein kinase